MSSNLLLAASAPFYMAPPRPSTASTQNTFEPSTSKRVPRNKNFAFKNGHRLHAFDPEKVPYPLSYDRDVLELESMDQIFVQQSMHSASVVDFKERGEYPERSLDLGCGSGTWVIEAAKEWPECYFVGFDLVDVQLPTSILDSDIAKRIEWVHGNFLTNKLPFDDDEFDHVHLQSIGRGVPENKWGMIFDEINRVLRPGGSVEVLEHDIIFPTLPRWFTSPLRIRSKRSESIHHPTNPSHPSSPRPSSPEEPHDHALLESLYYSVFESRFINLRPTAIVPIHFTSNFRQVVAAPVLHFRMPPLPPLQPLPQPLPPSAVLINDSEPSENPRSKSPLTTRPFSVSFSSTSSEATSNSASTGDSTLFSTSVMSEMTLTQPGTSYDRSFSSSASSTVTSGNDASPNSRKPLYIVDNSVAESTLTGVAPSHSLIRLDQIDNLSERALAMQLYWSYKSVLACTEAMWEELDSRIENRPTELMKLGWDGDPELSAAEENRHKFDIMVDRYEKDMHSRVSLWCSLTALGWEVPPREPLSRAELIEEERLYKAIIEARKSATEEDFQTPCRSVRIFVGFKAC